MYTERTRPTAPRAVRANPSRTVADVRWEIGMLRMRKPRPLPWRKIAELPAYCGVPPATLCAIYKHGREPQNNKYRRILRLPELAEVEICPRCHTPHQMKRCPPDPSRPRKRRTRKQRNRINLRQRVARLNKDLAFYHKLTDWMAK